jgi:hypothetical protein
VVLKRNWKKKTEINSPKNHAMKRNTIFYIIIAALVVVVCVQMQCLRQKPKPGVKILPPVIEYRDTGTVIHDTPQLASQKPIPVPIRYLTDTRNVDSLLALIKELKNELYTQRVYTGTYWFDKSSIDITDTIAANQHIGRGIDWHLSEKIINNSKEITLPPRRKVFVGAEVGAPFKLNGLRAGVGVLYENRRENIVGGALHTDNFGNLDGELKFYFKLGKRRY